MWLLLLMIAIMPYEQNPYLQLGENLLGVFAGFTVIKALGLLGFAWAGLRMMSGDAMTYRLGARPASLFFVFLTGTALLGLVHGSGFQYGIGRYIAYAVFLPFLLVAVRTQADLGRVLTWMVWSYVAVFPYALRQMVRYDDRLGVGIYESNYMATILVLLVPVAFAFASLQRVPRRRWLWLGAGLTLVVMIVLTGSRGGFVGLVAAGVVFVYRRRGLAAAAGVLLILIVGVLATAGFWIAAGGGYTLQVRRWLAPYLARGFVAYGAFAIAFLLFVWLAPLLTLRNVLIVAVLGLIGFEVLRRQIAAEFPDAGAPDDPAPPEEAPTAQGGTTPAA